jgi:hypothetical protein
MSKMRHFICKGCGATVARPYVPMDDDICLNCWHGKPKT